METTQVAGGIKQFIRYILKCAVVSLAVEAVAGALRTIVNIIIQQLNRWERNVRRSDEIYGRDDYFGGDYYCYY